MPELNKINILKSNVEEKELENLRLFILCFYDKNKEEFVKNRNEFEKKFVQVISMFLIQEYKGLYWNIFLSSKIEYIKKDETDLDYEKNNFKNILLELNLDQFKQLKNKPKVLIFQQKGKNEPYFSTISKKWKELIIFLCMIGLFFSLIMCPKVNEGDTAYQYCSGKYNITYIFGVLIFVVIIFNMIQKIKNKKQKKLKIN